MRHEQKRRCAMSKHTGVACPCCSEELVDDNPEGTSMAEQWASCNECGFSINLQNASDPGVRESAKRIYREDLIKKAAEGQRAQALLDKMHQH